MTPPDLIAIDGPAASGKTTLALLLAHDLGYVYLDTGVMYRAVTLLAMRNGVALSDEPAVTKLAETSDIDVVAPTVDDGRTCTVKLNGDDVTREIRDYDIDTRVSISSAYPGVRVAMTDRQRKIGERGKVVMVGRDIGTVVLPQADFKIYLDASIEARARRRWQESHQNGKQDSYEAILEAMRRRDQIDSERAIAPLRPADDAYVIDSTNLDAEEVYRRVEEILTTLDP